MSKGGAADVQRCGSVRVPISCLQVRYIPGVTPDHLWQRGRGAVDMGIMHSPHVELYLLYKRMHRHPTWEQLLKTRYVRERLLRGKQGQNRWTEHYLRNRHLPKRFELYESIRKHGLLDAYPIAVLLAPFWQSRFGYPVPLHPDYELEIWTGAGRAAAAHVLGHKTIRAQFCRDTHPGSGLRGKFGKKLADNPQVWELTRDRGQWLSGER